MGTLKNILEVLTGQTIRSFSTQHNEEINVLLYSSRFISSFGIDCIRRNKSVKFFSD